MGETFRGWTEHGWGFRVSNPDQLLRMISRIALLEGGRSYAWRGQANADWRLCSSAFRHLSISGVPNEAAIRSHELELLDEARRWGIGKELGPSASDMHLISLLQHHGLPTRFIDVTSDPMTALWFACQPAPRVSDGPWSSDRAGVLFAIDVTSTDWYRSFDHKTPTFGTLKDPLGWPYEYALEQSTKTKRAFRVFSTLPDERMKAQSGYFLASAKPYRPRIPGVDDIHIAGSAPGPERLHRLVQSGERGAGRPPGLPLCAIVIPPDVKTKLRTPLKRTYNRRRRVLFPDVAGFSEAYKLEELD